MTDRLGKWKLELDPFSFEPNYWDQFKSFNYGCWVWFLRFCNNSRRVKIINKMKDKKKNERSYCGISGYKDFDIDICHASFEKYRAIIVNSEKRSEMDYRTVVVFWRRCLMLIL